MPEAKKVPISRHPAFPAIVALWFAALLGIGSLVLPVVLFEKIVTASGLAAIVPAAAPPLGVTARIMIAVVGACLGVVAGLALARRVVAAQSTDRVAEPRAPRQPAQPARATRPILAHEELGAASFDDSIPDAAPALRGRRRALAVTDESGPSAWLDPAPLPGPDIELEVEAADAPDVAFDLAPRHAEPEDEIALVLDQVADAMAEDEDEAPTAAASEPAPFVAAGAIVAAPEHDCAPYEEDHGERPFDAPAFVAAELPETAPVADDPAPAPNFIREAPMDQTPDHPSFSAPADGDWPDEPAVSAFENLQGELAAQPPAEQTSDDHAGLADRPLGELSMAELVERFAMSLRAAASREETAPEAPAPARYVPDLGVAAEEAPRLLSDPEPELPAAMQPIAFDDEAEEEDDLPSFALPSRDTERPFAQAAGVSFDAFAAQGRDDYGEDGNDDDDSTDDGYSSLLDMRGRLASEREFVRIEDDDEDDDEVEPVVVFPGQELRDAAPVDADDEQADEAGDATLASQRPFDAPGNNPPVVTGARSADPNQAEEALRDALHKLQRLSGAA